MNLRQCQNQARRPVWEFEKNHNKYPQVPKNQATAQCFSAHNAKHEWAFHHVSVLDNDKSISEISLLVKKDFANLIKNAKRS